MGKKGKNRINYLRKVVAVQNIVLEEKKRGVSQILVFRNVIYPRFFITEKTFYRWLGEPAKLELAELEEKEKIASI